ncbi:putative guanine nucleotide-binding protein [Paratrimastix pyriformis]|uniref:Guanine nucleotide-binding protein n=1 Tax=Paratrimastix pyriformis TaxID=342808 RepID=A0ABQ8UVT2_9EUKA|nr:putative guanine nucleotide-binding protein [Paratrimastix pyriformis]|eukprot:GAFH01003040.1.p2 GENE.GAFH01003040.1~~GAFH01003040.1.p2  ORF type:complete len:329 (+),score=93.05 GAFH01003040.1:22-987(+)
MERTEAAAALCIPKGVLRGHDGWVTSLAATNDLIISGSRDKSVMMWALNDSTEHDALPFVPRRRMTGHNHFVEDVILSSDGQYALSASWDKTLRLWDINSGVSTQLFRDHQGDVLCVAFSPDNRQIVSGARDKTIKLWNTLGECKYTIQECTEWVTSAKFSPRPDDTCLVTAGYDRLVRVWDKNTCQLKTALEGHTGYINAVAISPDGSLCASGGKDTSCNLWDLQEGKYLFTLDCGDIINDLVFSPARYWLITACDSGIKIWCLETKTLVVELQLQSEELEGETPNKMPRCLSVAFSEDGLHLFAGYSDGNIRIWDVPSK